MALTEKGSLQSKELKEQTVRKEYNANVTNIADEIKALNFVGNVVLVKLYQFELDSITTSGIIIPKYKNKQSDGERPTAVLDDFKYQHRGVLHAIGTDCTAFTKKDLGKTVWLSERSVSPTFQFLHKREVPVVDFEGYLLMSPALVQATEK